MPLNCVTMRLKGIFVIGKHEKTLNNQNPNPRRCNTKSLWAPLGLFGQPTSRCCNLVILPLFGAYDTLLERSRYYLCLAHTIPFWKGLVVYYRFRHMPLPMAMGLPQTPKKAI